MKMSDDVRVEEPVSAESTNGRPPVSQVAATAGLAAQSQTAPPRRSWRRSLGFRNIGVIYVWILIIILFSFWAPNTFPTWTTAQSILNQNAVSGLMALTLVVPLSSRIFDLSIGNAMGLCNVFVAWLLVQHGMPVGIAVICTLATGVIIGLLNATVVIGAKIDSFIGTLATGALMAAGTDILSKEEAIVGPQLGGGFAKISTTPIIHGIDVPVFLMLAVAVIIWYLLNYTVIGRRIYATGFNEHAAHLTGIKTQRLRYVSLVVSGAVAGATGILLAAQVRSGSPGIGPPYLLDAFAAAFLGATQFGGRFNAWGTVFAVLLLGTGDAGLVLVSAPAWSPSMFSGAVLLLALVLTKIERTAHARGLIMAKLRRGHGDDRHDLAGTSISS